VPWNVKDYLKRIGKKPTGMNDEFEDKLKKEFPPGTEIGTAAIWEPCIIVDSKANILLWHLPDIVSQNAEVRFQAIMGSNFALIIPKQTWREHKDLLQEALKQDGRRSSSWRNKPELFKEGLDGQGGILNWSPAWFQSAKHVR
jgi:hypothetical protein